MAFVVTTRIALPFDSGVTTSSFTPSDNSILVCVVHSLQLFAVNDLTWTITDSLSGTWTERINAVRDADFGTQVRVFTREVTTGASMTVTAAFSGFLHSDGTSNELDVFDITGHDTVGSWFGGVTGSEIATSSGSPHTLSLTGTSDSTSMVLGVVTADGDYGAPVVAEGSGNTAIYKHVNGSVGGWQRQTAQYKVGAISSIDFGDPTYAYPDAYAALEIKAASGGAAPFLPDNRPQRAAPIMAQ